MIRQRIVVRIPWPAYVVRALTALLGAATVWYGLMVVLLAVKVSPHAVNQISAYRTLYRHAAELTTADFTTPVRLVAGFTGLMACLLFVYLTAGQLPRPSLARSDMTLDKQQRGTTLVKPRAIERIAEYASQENPGVVRAHGRLGNQELSVTLTTARATTVSDTLKNTQDRVIAALAIHDLPRLPVNVTLAGYDSKTRRELS